MKRFSFRLENILKYRNYMEKRAQMALLDVRNEYMRRENRVKELATIRTGRIIKCRDEATRGLDVPVYKIHQAFLQKLDHDLAIAHMDLQEGKQQVKIQEKILKGESIKKRSLETLKDLQLKNYIKNLEQEDQKFMDEMVTMRKGGKA
ncbi:MAG: flagellar export protein FliJ [Desulfobacterales bacterium]|nr:flagellar export protein FliJ [Desulfobacterales bacterium]